MISKLLRGMINTDVGLYVEQEIKIQTEADIYGEGRSHREFGASQYLSEPISNRVHLTGAV